MQRKLDIVLVPAGTGTTGTVVATAGEGGWGNPLHRELDRVRQDVLDGYVSIESAARDYGVIIDSQTLEVDAGARDGALRDGSDAWR